MRGTVGEPEAADWVGSGHRRTHRCRADRTPGCQGRSRECDRREPSGSGSVRQWRGQAAATIAVGGRHPVCQRVAGGLSRWAVPKLFRWRSVSAATVIRFSRG